MNRRKFLVETGFFAYGMSTCAKLLAGLQPGEHLRIQTPIICVDRPNGNGHLYTKESVENMLSKLFPNTNLFGTVGFPAEPPHNIQMKDISHKVNRLYMKDWMDTPWLHAEIEILDTPQGRVLKDVMKDQDICFRTSAEVSDYKYDENNICIVHDFEIKSVNAIPTSEASHWKSA